MTIQIKRTGQRTSPSVKAVRKTANVVGAATLVATVPVPRIHMDAIANAQFNIRREARRIVLQKDSNARAEAFLKSQGRTITLP